MDAARGAEERTSGKEEGDALLQLGMQEDKTEVKKEYIDLIDLELLVTEDRKVLRSMVVTQTQYTKDARFNYHAYLPENLYKWLQKNQGQKTFKDPGSNLPFHDGSKFCFLVKEDNTELTFKWKDLEALYKSLSNCKTFSQWKPEKSLEERKDFLMNQNIIVDSAIKMTEEQAEEQAETRLQPDAEKLGGSENSMTEKEKKEKLETEDKYLLWGVEDFKFRYTNFLRGELFRWDYNTVAAGLWIWDIIPRRSESISGGEAKLEGEIVALGGKVPESATSVERLQQLVEIVVPLRTLVYLRGWKQAIEEKLQHM